MIRRGPLPPKIAITHPPSGRSYLPGTVVQIEAEAHDQDGTVTNVAFYVNDSLLGNWRIKIADDRTVYGRIIESVYPSKIYPVAVRFAFINVIVAFHVINNEEVQVAGDWAFSRGTYTLSITPKAGGEEIFIDGKYMTILKRQTDGSWKIHRDIFNSNVE